MPFLMFRMNECCDGMDAKEQLYTAGGFAFSFSFFSYLDKSASPLFCREERVVFLTLVIARSVFCDAATQEKTKTLFYPPNRCKYRFLLGFFLGCFAKNARNDG